MLRRRHLLLVITISFTLAACTARADRPVGNQALAASAAIPTATPGAVPTRTPEAVPANPPASCPITRPQDPPFAPPPPSAPTAPPLYSGFWYGTEALWTMPRTDGIWGRLPYYGGAYSQKTFWWSRGYDWRKEPEPALTVTGRRLDSPAPPLTSSRATNGFRDDIGSFMLVGIEIPTPGCWEITGHHAGVDLPFVVWVAP